MDDRRILGDVGVDFVEWKQVKEHAILGSPNLCYLLFRNQEGKELEFHTNVTKILHGSTTLRHGEYTSNGKCQKKVTEE